MGSTKSCPLLLAATVVAMGAGAGARATVTGSVVCPGPACAWYDAARERCAILSRADVVRR